MERSERGLFAPSQCMYVTVAQTGQSRLPPGRKTASLNFYICVSVSSLTTWALLSGCSSRRRGRASCCGRRTGSIFLLISATVSAFAFLSLVVLLVGHCTGFGCQCYFRPLSTAAVNAAVWHFCGLHFCSGACFVCSVFLFVLLFLGSSWTTGRILCSSDSSSYKE